MNKVSFKVSLGGIISALCLFSMFLTGIMPLLVYTLPAIAGALLIVMVVEINKKTAFVTYVAVGLLSFLMTPDKEAAILFIMFFGYYPILKSLLEKVKIRAIEWVSKFLIFNIGVVLAYYIVINVLGTVDILKQFDEFGKYGAVILLLVGNAVFLLYDIALTRMISSYINWFRPKFLRRFK